MPDTDPTETAAVIFEMPLHVLPEDINGLGHVNNIAYLRWVREAATAHWNAGAS